MWGNQAILFLIYALKISFVYLRDNECHRVIRNEDLTYRRVTYCCHNYEDKNGECVECSIGYTSFDGNECKPCLPNNYGKRCAHECTSCSDNQRCDNVIGCVDMLTTVFAVTEDSAEKRASIEKTSTGNFGIYSTDRRIINNVNISSELSLRELVIYSLSGAVLLIIIIINLVCVLYCQRNGRCPCGKTRKMSVIVGDSNRRHNEVVNSIYDEIEDLNLVQQQVVSSNVLPVIKQKLDSSSEDEIVSETNSYIHPYQPITEDANPHGYDINRKAVDVTVYYCVPKEQSHQGCSSYLTVVHSAESSSPETETSALEKPVSESQSPRKHEAEYLELFSESEITE